MSRNQHESGPATPYEQDRQGQVPESTETESPSDVVSYPSTVIARNSVTAWIISMIDPARWVQLQLCIDAADAAAVRHVLQQSEWTLLHEAEGPGGTVVFSLESRRLVRIFSNRRDEAAAQIHALLALHSVRSHWITTNDSLTAEVGLFRWAIPTSDGSAFRDAEHDSIYLTTSDSAEAARLLSSGEITGIDGPVAAEAHPRPASGPEAASFRIAGVGIVVGLLGGIGLGLLLVLAPNMPPANPTALVAIGVVILIAMATGVARFVEAKAVLGESWRDRVARAARIGWSGPTTPKHLKALTYVLWAFACAQVGLEAVIQFPKTGGVQAAVLVAATLATFGAGHAWNRVRRTWTPPRVPWRVAAAAGWLVVLVFLARLVTDEFFGMLGVPVGTIDLDPAVIFGVAAIPMLAGIGAVLVVAGVWALIYRGRFAAPMNWILGALFVGTSIGGFTHAADATLRHAVRAIENGTADDSLGYQVPWICLTPIGPTTPQVLSELTKGPVRKLGDFKDQLVLLEPSSRQPNHRSAPPRVRYLPSIGITYIVVDGSAGHPCP